MGQGGADRVIVHTILEALAGRADEGMTIFELRNHVDVDIDTIETTLEQLKAEGLITTAEVDGRLVIRPTSSGLATVEDADADGVLDRLRERLPL